MNEIEQVENLIKKEETDFKEGKWNSLYWSCKWNNIEATKLILLSNKQINLDGNLFNESIKKIQFHSNQELQDLLISYKNDQQIIHKKLRKGISFHFFHISFLYSFLI